MATFGEIGYINLGDCISCIDFSAGGDYFAAGCTDESIYIWYFEINLQEGKLRAIR
jgi:WD40 repeat protein